MRGFSDLRLDIINFLADDIGHAHWEILEFLEVAKKVRHDKGNLTRTLESMEDSSLIYEGERRLSTNPINEGKKFEEEPYYLIREAETFSNIVDQFVDRSLRESPNSDSCALAKYSQQYFLESNYVNNLIKGIGFKSVVVALKGQMEDREFRKSASHIILSHPATIEEYELLPQSVEEWFREMDAELKFVNRECIEQLYPLHNVDEVAYKRHQRMDLLQEFADLNKKVASNNINKVPINEFKVADSGRIEQLDLLHDLDKIEAVRFYRKTLLNDFADLYLKRAGNNIRELIHKLAVRS